MNLLLCFIVIVGITMVSTNQIIVNNFLNFPNENVDVTKGVCEKTNIHKWSFIASIWVKDTTKNSIMTKLSCTGVIITEKHILTEKSCVDNLPIETIGIGYGVQDTRNLKFGDFHSPKKASHVQKFLTVLEMHKIKCTELVQPACIWPYFGFENKTLTLTGFARILGTIKTINTSLVTVTQCGVNESKYICQSTAPTTDESNMISPGSPILWFNPENKKWILVGIEWPHDNLNAIVITGYNISYFYPSIKKIVEDGSSKLSTC